MATNGKKHICMGVLAHVDAGKTTLSEALLFHAGAIRALGRVDHKNTYLDTDSMERDRGITIFSKQARLHCGETDITLMDTPGHVDFSAEMERVLQVLDYAVLVISGTDGVQAHTETLRQLLGRYRIPAFLFVTKMDLAGADREKIMQDLKQNFHENCVDFSAEREAFCEEAAVCEEAAMEHFLENGDLTDGELARMIAERKLYPCFFGSGLKMEGVAEFADALDRYTLKKEYSAEFGARVYKIMRDAQGNRLTCMKITGGSLRQKAAIGYQPRKGEARSEKINSIRLYSGAKFDTAEEVTAGQICAVQGLTETYPGQGIGRESTTGQPMLEPVLNYRILLPKGCDARTMLPKLRLLEEEDPQLHISWNEILQEIHVQLMGTVQIEILKNMVKNRFDVEIGVDRGKILYLETIANTVEGVGHFEPLRHYAEVHLLMEPAERGTGLVFDTDCSEDQLDRNWQRLILTHLEEKMHIGVLTGSPITDMRISLLAGRAHAKHTEGGDFRQATYRAVRQGLMQAESVLLEPYYEFRLAVPSEQIGRAISDIRAMNGTFGAPELQGEMAVLTGQAPVATMYDYQTTLMAYTHGCGRLSCRVAGYAPCHNAEEVIGEMGYEPHRDLENPADSVFCSHGAGVNIPWDKVREHMHVDTGFGRKEQPLSPNVFRRGMDIDEKELEAIMLREFGPIKRPMYRKPDSAQTVPQPIKLEPIKKERLIIDGYNVIFAWDELKELAAEHLDSARKMLMDLLSNYSGFTKTELVLVFDGYRVKGNAGERFDYHNIHVVYTREGEQADIFMERLAADIGKNESVRIVTSDNLIRLTALRVGLRRTSAREFHHEVSAVMKEIEKAIEELNKKH